MTRIEAAQQYIRLHDNARELAQVGWDIPAGLVRDMGEAEYMYNLLTPKAAVPSQRRLEVLPDRVGTT